MTPSQKHLDRAAKGDKYHEFRRDLLELAKHHREKQGLTEAEVSDLMIAACMGHLERRSKDAAQFDRVCRALLKVGTLNSALTELDNCLKASTARKN